MTGFATAQTEPGQRGWTDQDEADFLSSDEEQEHKLNPWAIWAADLDSIWWQRSLPDWFFIQWAICHAGDLINETTLIFWGVTLSHLDGLLTHVEAERILDRLLLLERDDAKLINTVSGEERTEESWRIPLTTWEKFQPYAELAVRSSERIKEITDEIKRLDGLFKEHWDKRVKEEQMLDPDGHKSMKEYRRKHPWLGLGKSYDAARYYGREIPYNRYLVMRWHQEGLSG